MSHDTRTILLERSRSTLNRSDERIRRAQQLVEDSRSLIRGVRAADLWPPPRVPADALPLQQQQLDQIIQRNACLIAISRELIHIARTLVSSNRERTTRRS
jgi:hypothetical protein